MSLKWRLARVRAMSSREIAFRVGRAVRARAERWGLGLANAPSALGSPGKAWLPNLPLQGNLTVNAGSLVICAPEGLGLRLNTGNNPISSNDFDRAGLVRTDDGWETPGYATAAIRTELDVSANAGSLSLNPSQPCSQ